MFLQNGGCSLSLYFLPSDSKKFSNWEKSSNSKLLGFNFFKISFFDLISMLSLGIESNLVVTTGNNIVAGPTTSNNTTTLGNVLSILALGAATTAYIGTLQIRYRTRVA